MLDVGLDAGFRRVMKLRRVARADFYKYNSSVDALLERQIAQLLDTVIEREKLKQRANAQKA